MSDKNKICVETEYKDSVLELWKKFEDLEFLQEEYRRCPTLPKYLKKNSLLFIGVNPSFRKGAVIRDKIEFYQCDKNKDVFFKKFDEVAKYCNEEDNWTHLDLLFVRETQQKKIDDLTYTKNGVAFLEEQLDISFKMIREINPKMIIVANSLASEFFGKKKSRHKKLKRIWRGFSFDFEKDFCEEIGTYNIKVNDRQIPIVFSGMLSGQRALDIASLERLKWQVKLILEGKVIR